MGRVMNTKEYMSQLWKLRYTIESMERRREALKEKAEYRGVKYTEEQRGTTHFGSEEIMAEVIDLEVKIKETEEEYRKTKEKIKKAIARVTRGDEREVLEMRYLLFLGWEEIAGVLNLTLRRVYQINGSALRSVTPYLEARE